MPTYKFTALNANGQKSYNMKQYAENETELRLELKKRGYTLLKAKAKKDGPTLFSSYGKVKMKEVVAFLRQFSVMINASISIVDSLYTLKNQRFSKSFRNVLNDIYGRVVSGKSLSASFGAFPDVFPGFFTSMVEVGEKTGSLPSVLNNMADYYEDVEKIKKKALSSMAYPFVLIGMIFIVVAFMVWYILPQFESMFKEFGNNTPAITAAVFGFGTFLRTHIIELLLGLFILIFALFIFFKFSPIGKRWWDNIVYHFPVAGTIYKSVATSRFSKAFILLLGSGMNIMSCLESLLVILPNYVYNSAFKKVIKKVKNGGQIGKSMEETGKFHPLLTNFIKIGEKSGNLEETLKATSKFFDDEIDAAIAKALAVLEPIIIIFLGLIVGVVLLSIYVPMIQLMEQIN